MEKLARATGGKIISNLNDLPVGSLGDGTGEFDSVNLHGERGVLGKAQVVEEVKKGENSLMYIRGCRNPRAVTLVLRGGTEHVLDEVERAIKDGLGDVISAVKSGRVVPGGGLLRLSLLKTAVFCPDSWRERTAGC